MSATAPTSPSRGALWVAIGAACIGFGPIWVRLSELGPFATAAYRLLIATPFFWIWLRWESGRPDYKAASHTPSSRADLVVLMVAGLMFAGDMALWNWSLHETSVANSTLITNLTPLLVMVAAWFLFGERVTMAYCAGLPLALAGVYLLVRSPSHTATAHWKGDALSAAATVFYAGYLLALRRLRKHFSAAFTLLHSGWVSASALFLIAWLSGETMWPSTAQGWGILVALAILAHTAGQGFIAYGFGHVSAAVGSLILLTQPVVAAALAWVWLKEPMTPWQLAGGALVIASLAIAARR